MLGTLVRRASLRGVQPSNIGALSWPDYLRLWEQFGFNGVQYMVPAGGMAQMTALQASRNPVVMRCFMIRGSVYSQIEFKFKDKRSGKLFGDPSLSILEDPWPGGSTDQLLFRTEFDVSRYGNSYWYIQPPSALRPYGTLVWLDPTSVNIVTGDVDGPSGKAVGKYLLAYQTQTKTGQVDETFLPNEIVHVRPIPDPNHPFRGLSWLAALLPDVVADQDLTDFVHAFVTNGATPKVIITHAANSGISKDVFEKFKQKTDDIHNGPANAFKTLYLGPGADAKVVGVNFEQMMLATTQSHIEVRLCMAAGVHPTLAGIAEGLKGSTLNAGNYAATRRSFADVTMRPLWKHSCAAGAFGAAAVPRPGARLWYDASTVPFIQADEQDAAAKRQADATTMLTLINGGFEPTSIIDAITGQDWSLLSHSGLVSVQLQPAGTLPPDGAPALNPPDDDDANQEDDPDDKGE